MKALTAERDTELDKLIEETFERELAKLPEEIRDRAAAIRAKPDKERTAEEKGLVKKYPFLNVNRGTVYLYLPDRQRAFNKNGKPR